MAQFLLRITVEQINRRCKPLKMLDHFDHLRGNVSDIQAPHQESNFGQFELGMSPSTTK
jgi:hypothetical protein